MSYIFKSKRSKKTIGQTHVSRGLHNQPYILYTDQGIDNEPYIYILYQLSRCFAPPERSFQYYFYPLL